MLLEEFEKKLFRLVLFFSLKRKVWGLVILLGWKMKMGMVKIRSRRKFRKMKMRMMMKF